MARLLPYEGDLPYVFVSYSHRNTDAAQQIIARMIEAGYRVWYDEGIDPGTPYDDVISAHVEGCGYFLALMSKEYLDSKYCQNELYYALNSAKPPVLVYLEPAELPSGLKMRLSGIQAILKYTYTDEEAFCAKLFRTRGLQVCLGEAPRPQTAAEPLRPQAAQRQEPAPNGSLLERLRDVMQPKEPGRPAGSPRQPEVDMSREPQLSAMVKSLNAHPAFTLQNIVHGAAITRLEIAVEGSMRMQTATEELQRMAPDLPLRIDVAAHSSVLTVEVPRQQRFTIPLREVLESDEMRKSAAPLPMALGRDIDGSPVICDLTRMPHLLVAYNPIWGISDSIYPMLFGLLHRCTPKEMNLILVDSNSRKTIFSDAPHLIAPVISEPRKAVNALGWAVKHMKERFQLLQDAGVRDLAGYNRKASDSRKLPRLVIVISELADLMANCAKAAEDSIVRLAQLGRAVGIHLIVATRRPTVDVLTGLIKANIFSRIAFKVESPVDSRTILDRAGAEKLIGNGDMLYMPSIANSPLRVQGCAVSSEERDSLTETFRLYSPMGYSASLLAALAQEIQMKDEPAIDPDLLIQAVAFVVEDGRSSPSLLQRRLHIGYARAARLMDQMEALGVIGPMDGAKPRMCLITHEEFEAMKAEGVFHDVQ